MIADALAASVGLSVGKFKGVIVAALAIFFGVISGSDAFLVALSVLFLVLVTLVIVPPHRALFFLPFLLLFGYIGLISSSWLDIFRTQWEYADQGGARTQLYLHAIQAWLDTPFSMMFGHGAGSFSGIPDCWEK